VEELGSRARVADLALEDAGHGGVHAGGHRSQGAPEVGRSGLWPALGHAFAEHALLRLAEDFNEGRIEAGPVVQVRGLLVS